MASAVIATGNEVVQVVAPDGAGHPAAVLKGLTPVQLNNYAGTDFVSSGNSISVTSSTTFVDTTLDTPPLVAGASYLIIGYLSIANGASGGLKLAPTTAGTGVATATLLSLDTWAWNTTTLAAQGNVTALSSNLVALTGAVTVVQLTGLLTVNAAGTFGLQFAQNASNATATTLNAGSWLYLSRIA